MLNAEMLKSDFNILWPLVSPYYLRIIYAHTDIDVLVGYVLFTF